ncbi:uncharacterized protein OCT59_002504 [Rhizophagus irregularis]|nr:hypothetical protein OCT59_002504 [Rhizophagus irregularis]
MFLSKLSKLLKKESSFVKLCKVNNMSDNNDNNENDSKTSNKNFESEDKPEWYEAHKLAIQNNQHFYIDPVTGYKVMTELYHKSRGRCCGSKCRHCPFNHENVGKNINLQDLIDNEKKNDDDENKK